MALRGDPEPVFFREHGVHGTDHRVSRRRPAMRRRDQRRDPIPAVPSFLDLTSSLARLVRGASIPGSPARDVSKTRSESPVGRMGPGPADSSSSGRGFARGETARDGKASAASSLAASSAATSATSLAAASATNSTGASRSSAFGFLGFDRLVARASRAARSFGFGSSGRGACTARNRPRRSNPWVSRGRDGSSGGLKTLTRSVYPANLPSVTIPRMRIPRRRTGRDGEDGG